MESNKLQNLSSAFANLKKLRYLYMSNNNISSLPLEIFNSGLCHSLRAMKFAFNNLELYPSDVLKSCNQLSHLDLGYNKITHLQDFEMRSSCDNLDTLILRGNQIQELEARLFKDCAKLRELSLSFNSLKRIDSEAFRNVGDTLESLEISFGFHETVRLFPGRGLRPLVKLLWLALDNNGLDEIGETDLYSLGELQYLNLESNSFTHLPKNLMHKNVHKKLLDVRLSYNKLRMVASHTFSSLNTLQTVSMTGNMITQVEAFAFHDLPNLKAVLLTQNQIGIIAPRWVKGQYFLADFMWLLT